MYISICIRNKNCHRNSSKFQNLMSSWGVGIIFSKFLKGNVFLKNHVNMVISKMVLPHPQLDIKF